VKQTTRLSIVLALNISIITGLLFVGLSSHSLGVLAAGGDYLLDCSAITLGLLAIYIRDRANGRSKATTIVALINSVFLLIITSYVVFEAVHRLSTDTPEINALPVLIVSSIAAVVMVIGAFIIGGDDDDNDLHMRSVLLDTISDAVAAAALAITGAIILVTKGFYWADSVVALMIAIVIAYQALKLLRDVVRELRK
jgi:cobalt-zinc-cadmium efflux system protein